MEQLWISLLAAVISALIASMIGTLAARVRFSASRGLRWALDILFLLPLVVPSISAYVTSIFASSENQIVVAMEMIWVLPVFYFCAVIGFRKVSYETIDAARLQGMGGCGIFWRVFFPTAWPWLLGGFAIGLSRGVFMALVTQATTQS